jgi:hypothetical protein
MSEVTHPHEVVLARKRARLSKYTGRELRLRTERVERAESKFRGFSSALSVPKGTATVRIKDEAKPSELPSWNVSVPDDRTVLVRARSEKEARAEARCVLELPRLPGGTIVERVQ